MWLRLGVGLLALFPNAGCKHHQAAQQITFPKGETVNVGDVEAFRAKMPVTFYQYEGFKGDYDDPHLRRFTLVLASKSAQSRIESAVLSDREIDQLAHERVGAIRFDAVPEAEMSFEALGKYLQAKYPGSRVESRAPSDRFVDAEAVVHDGKTGKTYCVIQYAKLGVPGSFVLLE